MKINLEEFDSTIQYFFDNSNWDYFMYRFVKEGEKEGSYLMYAPDTYKISLYLSEKEQDEFRYLSDRLKHKWAMYLLNRIERLFLNFKNEWREICHEDCY